MSKTKKKHSTAYKVFNVIFTLVLLVILVLLSVNAIWSMVDSTYVFSIFGYQFYTVVTDSMEDFIPVGSLVISKNVNNKTQFKDGDIITFNTKNTLSGAKMVVTHYYKDIEKKEDGSYQYVTYSEKQPDGDNFFVKYSDIRGKYVTHIAWVGKLALFLKSPTAMVMYAVIILIVLGASFFVKKSNKTKQA